VKLGGIAASVLVHVGLFVVVTRTEAPLPPTREKTAIRVIEPKPKPVEKTPEPKPALQATPVPEPAPPPPPKPEAPKPKHQPAPAPAPSNDAPPPSNAPPLDLGNMAFTNDSGSGPSVSPESLGRDPNEPKPKPRPVDTSNADKPKPKNEPAACTEELVKATAIDKVPIEYPAAAREQGIEGQLVLRAHIGADGKVGEVEIVRSAGPLIDEPAVAALKRWTFTPATKCGKATESTFTIARRFEIGT